MNSDGTLLASASNDLTVTGWNWLEMFGFFPVDK
jgi:hypothetical protein